MATSKINKVTVAHVWDDDSITEYDISVSADDCGPYVTLQQSGDVVRLRAESWAEIRNQIDVMFDEERVFV